MLRVLAAVLMLAATAAPARAEGERAGDFDYLVLALSWSANWCALTGDARGSEQCGAERDFDWVVHGLWPQYEQGWPSYCRTDARAPSRALTAAQADLFGAGGAAWYQWKKHGSCTGLTAAQYYQLVRLLYGKVTRPEVLARLDHAVRLPAAVVEEAFLKANPGMTADEITITCDAGYIQEARICFGTDFKLRPCAPDTARDCRLDNALLEPVR